MKKRIALLALAALALLALAGCRAETETEGQTSPAIEPAVPEDSNPPAASRPAGTDGAQDDPLLTGPVTARVKLMTKPNQWGGFLVTDWEGTEYPVGLCSASAGKFTGADGEALAVDELRPGMILDITWGGSIAESYPNQLFADEVRVVEQGDDLVGLYCNILAGLWAETGQKTGVKQLGFDFSGLTGLSDGEQEALAYLTAGKLEMGFSYYPGTWDELVDVPYIAADENGYWTDGMMLSLSLYDQADGHAGIIASSSRSKGGVILVLTCMADRQEDGSWSYQTFSPSGT